MAGKCLFCDRRSMWYMKWKPDPKGKWVHADLGRHPTPYPPSRPPKKPPAYIQERRDEMAEAERKAKLGLTGAVAVDKGLASYVTAYADAYAGTHKPNSVLLLKRYLRYLLAYADERGVKTLKQANKSFLRDYLEMRAGLVKRSSLKTEKTTLSPIWSRAAMDELIPSNPWKLVPVPGKAVDHDPRFWTSDEIRRIAAACRKPWARDLVQVLANTGIRVSAALAMEWAWIDWANSTIKIPPEHDKAGRGYKVAMTAGARDQLQPMHAGSDSPYVFPDPKGKPRAYPAAKGNFNRAVARSGVPPGTLHDLRHSFARHLAETVPLNVVQAALGHGSLAMTQQYVRLAGENTAKFVEGISLGRNEPATSPSS